MNHATLGFGCMRLPLQNADDPTSFDIPATEALFDQFLEEGFTYFDTAYTYHGYHGEEAVGRALSARHPRESFELATKMPLRDFRDREDMEKIFQEQLDHCGVTYFDAYLLHNMGTNVYEKCRQHGAFDFLVQKKKEGAIRSAGISFHDSPELLEKILTEYGECLDFVQLQINYLDWDQANVQSHRCLGVARRHQKPVVVMEPCKGGTLVNLPEEARALLCSRDPQASPASWAFRFAASQPGVIRVLSGMNAPEQVRENAATFRDFRPLTQEEQDLLWQVADILKQNIPMPCTGCGYCTHGCPQEIAIPQYFALYNSIASHTGSFSSHGAYYNNLSLQHGKASDCIGCRQCEAACPQYLPITQYLKKVAEEFETASPFPVRK